MTRYLGVEPCTNRSQVIEYLEGNYIGDDGKPMPHETAREIVFFAREQIAKGIQIFRSNVCYLGDEAVQNYGGNAWHQLPEPDGDGDDDA